MFHRLYKIPAFLKEPLLCLVKQNAPLVGYGFKSRIDVTGVRQLGGLASELARQTAGKAQRQQDSVLSDTQQLDIGSLYGAPPLRTQGVSLRLRAERMTP